MGLVSMRFVYKVEFQELNAQRENDGGCGAMMTCLHYW